MAAITIALLVAAFALYLAFKPTTEEKLPPGDCLYGESRNPMNTIIPDFDNDLHRDAEGHDAGMIDPFE